MDLEALRAFWNTQECDEMFHINLRDKLPCEDARYLRKLAARARRRNLAKRIATRSICTLLSLLMALLTVADCLGGRATWTGILASTQGRRRTPTSVSVSVGQRSPA
jgi:hypothetical protein